MWYVVRNGEIVRTFATEDEAVDYLNKTDAAGDMEIYPEEGRIYNE